MTRVRPRQKQLVHYTITATEKTNLFCKETETTRLKADQDHTFPCAPRQTLGHLLLIDMVAAQAKVIAFTPAEAAVCRILSTSSLRNQEFSVLQVSP